LQGRDEERAFPVRTRNWQFKEGRKRLCGGAKGSSAASLLRHGLYRLFFRLRHGALAAGWTSAPSWGR